MPVKLTPQFYNPFPLNLFPDLVHVLLDVPDCFLVFGGLRGHFPQKGEKISLFSGSIQCDLNQVCVAHFKNLLQVDDVFPVVLEQKVQ